MTFYVDPAIHLYRGQKWCHLFADTLDELHQAANQLGLKPRWFQDPDLGKTTMPHYDLAPSKRTKAIELGAVELTITQSGQMIHNYKRRAKAKELTTAIKVKSPGYWVEWNPDVQIWPDQPSGAFEIFGETGHVHYRRRHPNEVMALIN